MVMVSSGGRAVGRVRPFRRRRGARGPAKGDRQGERRRASNRLAEAFRPGILSANTMIHQRSASRSPTCSSSSRRLFRGKRKRGDKGKRTMGATRAAPARARSPSSLGPSQQASRATPLQGRVHRRAADHPRPGGRASSGAEGKEGRAQGGQHSPGHRLPQRRLQRRRSRDRRAPLLSDAHVSTAHRACRASAPERDRRTQPPQGLQVRS